jgi:hypothetical protein
VTSGNAFARDVLERIFPIPEDEFRICADGYLVTLAPLFGPVVSIDEPLGVYRIHDRNAWATLESAAASRFHRALEHDLSRYRALSKTSAELRLPAPDDPGMHDWLHLENRICSLAVDPAGHPMPSDSRAGLAWRGFRASRADRRLTARRRAMLACWFLMVGLLPRRLACQLVVWRMAPAARPWPLARLLRLIRGRQRHAPRVA